MRLLVSGSTRTVRDLTDRWGRDRLGVLLTPNNRSSMAATLATGLPWAADNGAFKRFDAERFNRFLWKINGAPRCLWVAAPDVVGDAKATLALFDQWQPILRINGLPVALVAQDGLGVGDDIPWCCITCLFIGGSTRWKLSEAAADLAAEAKRRGKLVHMGRVNSRRRMQVAADMGCDSIDGSSASMFGDHYIHKYCQWLCQIEAQPLAF
jgi:hypothetical protein